VHLNGAITWSDNMPDILVVSSLVPKALGAKVLLDLEDCVHYLGPKSLEDLIREIEECDVGIIPNHRSAFAETNTPTRIFGIWPWANY